MVSPTPLGKPWRSAEGLVGAAGASPEAFIDRLADLRVLVVDDHAFPRELLRSVLQTFGVRTADECPCPEAALKKMAETAYDLVLVDYAMPKMTGAKFTRAVRHSAEIRNTAVPIIMVSGHTDLDKVAESINCGVNDYMAKPFTAETLFKRIHSVMESDRPFVRTPAYIGPCRRWLKEKRAEQSNKRAA